MYVYSNNWEDKRKITDNNDKNVIQQFLADYYKFQQDYIKDQIVM